MTREEAIQFLQAVKECLLTSNSWLESTHEPIKEAFGMAIEALEQQPCEDCVSRQAAINAIPKTSPDLFENCRYCTMLDREEVIAILNGLPSVQPTYSLAEWCTDCKEYDQERHCCPRFNRVIRRTVEEIKGGEE